MPEIVINDTNWEQYTGVLRADDPAAAGSARMPGYLGRRTAYGDTPYTKPLEEGYPLIPRSDWDARIAANDANGGWLYNLCSDQLACLDQASLGYCHAYSCTTTIMAMRLVAGLPNVLLCPESIGGPVTGWRNQGAFIDDDLAQAVKGGCCDMSFQDKQWSLKPKNWKVGWEEEALNHRILEWWDGSIKGKMFDAAMTATLLGYPFESGHDWWGHAICGGFKARKGPNGYEILWINSWGLDYGERGYFWMAEGKGTPDVLFIPRVTTPSDQ